MLPSRGMINPMNTPPPFNPGKYRHHSGRLYLAIGLACHEATREWLVIYKPLYDHQGQPDVWVRPYDEFVGVVQTQEGPVPRYRSVKEEVVDEG